MEERTCNMDSNGPAAAGSSVAMPAVENPPRTFYRKLRRCFSPALLEKDLHKALRSEAFSTAFWVQGGIAAGVVSAAALASVSPLLTARQASFAGARDTCWHSLLSVYTEMNARLGADLLVTNPGDKLLPVHPLNLVSSGVSLVGLVCPSPSFLPSFVFFVLDNPSSLP